MTPARRRPRAVTPHVTDPLELGTERQWARVVEGLLDFYGWRWHHSPDNRPTVAAGGRAGRQRVGDRGFPDYVAARHIDGQGPELAFLELKTTTGRLGPGQPEWMSLCNALGAAVAEVAAVPDLGFLPPRIVVGVFRPGDRRDLEDLLAGPRGRSVMVDKGYPVLDT